jgi:hypothetical protein
MIDTKRLHLRTPPSRYARAPNNPRIPFCSDRRAPAGYCGRPRRWEAIGQQTGGIAHDFNNMLGVVMGSRELMDRRIKNGDFPLLGSTVTSGWALVRAGLLWLAKVSNRCVSEVARAAVGSRPILDLSFTRSAKKSASHRSSLAIIGGWLEIVEITVIFKDFELAGGSASLGRSWAIRARDIFACTGSWGFPQKCTSYSKGISIR